MTMLDSFRWIGIGKGTVLVSKTVQVQEQELVRNAKNSGTGTEKEHD